jgi:hypothetical protein
LSRSLEEHIYERVNDALETIPRDEREDIYVVSLFVYDEDDDPRKPTITVGFNTEADVAVGADDDHEEARWNYAFWRQGELDVLFSEDDQTGRSVRDDAIEASGYTFPGEDDLAREVTTPWFVATTVFAVRRLHDAGDIERIFGRTLPVLVHELEYYDAIAMQNLAANPPGVADEFVRWCRGL